MARTPGSVSKKTLEIRRKLAKMGIDPITELAKIGIRARDEGDLKVASKCFSELSQYTDTKLRSIEITGADGGPAYVAYMPSPNATAAEWMAQHAPVAKAVEDETDGDA